MFQWTNSVSYKSKHDSINHDVSSSAEELAQPPQGTSQRQCLSRACSWTVGQGQRGDTWPHTPPLPATPWLSLPTGQTFGLWSPPLIPASSGLHQTPALLTAAHVCLPGVEGPLSPSREKALPSVLPLASASLALELCLLFVLQVPV